MPRPKSNVPGYCLHRRTNRGYATIDGSQHTFPGAYNSAESRGGYDRLVAEYLSAARFLPAASTAPTGPTVAMVAAAFWHRARPTRSPRPARPPARRPTSAPPSPPCADWTARPPPPTSAPSR